MKDIYGLLLVLGFLIIISQCTSNVVEKFLNGNNGIVKSVENEVSSDIKSVEKIFDGNGNGNGNGKPSDITGYYPGSILLASSDKNSYGFNVPPSMQQEYSTNLSFGKARIPTPKSLVFFSDEQMQGTPIDSAMKTFDPSAKGGLSSLIGQTPPVTTPSTTNGLFNVSASTKGTNGKGTNGKGTNGKGANKKVDVHMVYASWCGWSKKAVAPFEGAMNEGGVTTSSGTPVEFKKTEEKSSEFKDFKGLVKGYPTFVAVKSENGKVVDRKVLPVKDRTTNGILESAKSVQH